MFPSTTVLCGIFLAMATSAAGDNQDEVFTCGGYLRSSMPIPFEKVKVKLLTTAGNLKSETEGTADLGYYLLPVYDKGKYQIRVEGPNGWAFDPPAVDIDIDGKDPCSKGRDINFDFKGFSVMGKVVSKGSTNGPAGAEVRLVDGGTTRTVKTLDGGNFVFPAVSPGVFNIKFRGEVAKVEVKNDNVRLSDSLFVIEGYSLKGKVNWDLPQATASIVLANQESVPCCGRGFSKDLPKGLVLPAKYQVSCVVKSASDGSYEFPCVKAASKYAVFAQVLTQSGQVVDISPSKIDLDVAHSDQVLDPFEVTGFPVSGYVKDAGGKVEIKVVGTDIEVVTDKDGYFKLGSLRSGQYNLQLKKNGFEFNNKLIVVDPARATLPDIFPDRFEVCGDVRVPDAVEIEVTSLETKQKVKARSDVSSGRFCTFLVRGEHVIKPKHSVRLSPWEVKIKVPLPEGQRLVFSQFSAIIKGRVVCLGNVCAGVKVALNGASSAKTVANSDGTFVFKNVDPGTYEICVSHSKGCFEKNCLPITVIDQNLENILFTQKGYLLRLESSHETELEVAGNVIKVSAGLSSHCIAETKTIPIKTVGCHRFAKEDKLVFNPNSEDTVVLSAESHRLKVEINSKLLVEDLKLNCKKGEEVQVVNLKEYKKSGDTYIYLTELHHAKGADLVLEPHSESLVFKPPQLPMRMPDDCIAIAISGRTGIFIEGTIKPPIAGVEITVATKENAKPCKAVTDANGRYRAGPLESQEYIIEAQKEGYGFERIPNSNDLTAVKYSRIDIKVVDGETNAPLAGALVSIAGGSEYRNTTKTGAQGELALIKLNPGDYHVRVMMKEYKFQPLSTMVSVSENSEELLLIKGKKVAYSVMGRVMSVTGESENAVPLVAISEGCDRHEEEAASDESGNFRIRGLREGCTYEIQLLKFRDGVQSKYERTLPAKQRVTIGRSDVTMNLIVVRPVDHTVLTVALHADPALLPSLRVALFRDNRQLYSLRASRFMIFPDDVPLDNGAYHVEVHHNNKKPPPHFQITLLNNPLNITDYSSVKLFSGRPLHHLELEIRVDEKATAAQGQTPAPASPFVAVLSVFVALAAFYRKELGALLRHRQDNSPAAGDRRKNRSR